MNIDLLKLKLGHKNCLYSDEVLNRGIDSLRGVAVHVENKALVNKQQKAGYFEVEFDASRLTSGVYFYKIQAGNF